MAADTIEPRVASLEQSARNTETAAGDIRTLVCISRTCKQRLPVRFAAQRLRLQQEQLAFLAGTHKQFPALVVNASPTQHFVNELDGH